MHGLLRLYGRLNDEKRAVLTQVKTTPPLSSRVKPAKNCATSLCTTFADRREAISTSKLTAPTRTSTAQFAAAATKRTVSWTALASTAPSPRVAFSGDSTSFSSSSSEKSPFWKSARAGACCDAIEVASTNARSLSTTRCFHQKNICKTLIWKLHGMQSCWVFGKECSCLGKPLRYGGAVVATQSERYGCACGSICGTPGMSPRGRAALSRHCLFCFLRICQAHHQAPSRRS
ncbi:hypothetical protein BC830DRAFT_678839 [Chytriomyces sp. MP71]|nr:hypothetical protein BC830DRAFT_678839 [Chytriomyces sp. MP71]